MIALWLFYLLIGLTVLSGVTVIAAVVCCCINCIKRSETTKKNSGKNKKKIQNVAIRTPIQFQYATAIQEQQVPFVPLSPSLRSPSFPGLFPTTGDLLAPRSVPGSPQNCDVIPRRHSFDPKTLADSLDPELYKKEEEEMRMSPSIGLGRLCFSVKYDSRTEILLVILVKAIKLPSRNGNIQPNPYVCLSLLPDKKRRLRSKTQKSCNPVFSEEFVFSVSEEDLPRRVLKFAVCDYDRFSRMTIIGYVMYPLSEIQKFHEGSDDIWSEISEDELPPGESKGTLSFSLSHLPTAGRLNVVILQAKNLRILGETGVCVKITMISGGKPIKTKKTAIVRKGNLINPSFSESFMFDVSTENLDKVSFVLAVCAYPRIGVSGKRVIGRSIVGPYMYSTGSGLAHWNEMLISARRPVSHWHKLF